MEHKTRSDAFHPGVREAGLVVLAELDTPVGKPDERLAPLGRELVAILGVGTTTRLVAVAMMLSIFSVELTMAGDGALADLLGMMPGEPLGEVDPMVPLAKTRSVAILLIACAAVPG